MKEPSIFSHFPYPIGRKFDQNSLLYFIILWNGESGVGVVLWEIGLWLNLRGPIDEQMEVATWNKSLGGLHCSTLCRYKRQKWKRDKLNRSEIGWFFGYYAVLLMIVFIVLDDKELFALFHYSDCVDMYRSWNSLW